MNLYVQPSIFLKNEWTKALICELTNNFHIKKCGKGGVHWDFIRRALGNNVLRLEGINPNVGMAERVLNIFLTELVQKKISTYLQRLISYFKSILEGILWFQVFFAISNIWMNLPVWSAIIHATILWKVRFLSSCLRILVEQHFGLKGKIVIVNKKVFSVPDTRHIFSHLIITTNSLKKKNKPISSYPFDR